MIGPSLCSRRIPMTVDFAGICSSGKMGFSQKSSCRSGNERRSCTPSCRTLRTKDGVQLRPTNAIEGLLSDIVITNEIMLAFRTICERTRFVKNQMFRWAALLSANLFLWGVLSFYESSSAAPPSGQPPFANPIEQRHEIIRELQQIKTLLQEQVQLLRTQVRADKTRK